MAEDINDLRAEVAKLHRSAGNKISRMKRVNGVAISGTANDPRRDLGNVSRYNRRQLESYKSQLQRFNSRNVGFARTADGGITNRGRANLYKRLQRRWNNRVDRMERDTENIPASRGNAITIGDRRDMTRTRLSDKGVGGASQKPFARIRRDIENIANIDAAIKDMQRRLRPSYVSDKLSSQRVQFSAMADQMGLDMETRLKAMQLNDYQFNILFNETDTVNYMGMSYFAAQNFDESRRQNMRGMLETHDEVITDRVNYVSGLTEQ